MGILPVIRDGLPRCSEGACPSYVPREVRDHSRGETHITSVRGPGCKAYRFGMPEWEAPDGVCGPGVVQAVADLAVHREYAAKVKAIVEAPTTFQRGALRQLSAIDLAGVKLEIALDAGRKVGD